MANDRRNNNNRSNTQQKTTQQSTQQKTAQRRAQEQPRSIYESSGNRDAAVNGGNYGGMRQSQSETAPKGGHSYTMNSNNKVGENSLSRLNAPIDAHRPKGRFGESLDTAGKITERIQEMARASETTGERSGNVAYDQTIGQTETGQTFNKIRNAVGVVTATKDFRVGVAASERDRRAVRNTSAQVNKMLVKSKVVEKANKEFIENAGGKRRANKLLAEAENARLHELLDGKKTVEVKNEFGQVIKGDDGKPLTKTEPGEAFHIDLKSSTGSIREDITRNINILTKKLDEAGIKNTRSMSLHNIKRAIKSGKIGNRTLSLDEKEMLASLGVMKKTKLSRNKNSISIWNPRRAARMVTQQTDAQEGISVVERGASVIRPAIKVTKEAVKTGGRIAGKTAVNTAVLAQQTASLGVQGFKALTAKKNAAKAGISVAEYRHMIKVDGKVQRIAGRAAGDKGRKAVTDFMKKPIVNSAKLVGKAGAAIAGKVAGSATIVKNTGLQKGFHTLGQAFNKLGAGFKKFLKGFKFFGSVMVNNPVTKVILSPFKFFSLVGRVKRKVLMILMIPVGLVIFISVLVNLIAGMIGSLLPSGKLLHTWTMWNSAQPLFEAEETRFTKDMVDSWWADSSNHPDSYGSYVLMGTKYDGPEYTFASGLSWGMGQDETVAEANKYEHIITGYYKRDDENGTVKSPDGDYKETLINFEEGVTHGDVKTFNHEDELKNYLIDQGVDVNDPYYYTRPYYNERATDTGLSTDSTGQYQDQIRQDAANSASITAARVNTQGWSRREQVIYEVLKNPANTGGHQLSDVAICAMIASCATEAYPSYNPLSSEGVFQAYGAPAARTNWANGDAGSGTGIGLRGWSYGRKEGLIYYLAERILGQNERSTVGYPEIGGLVFDRARSMVNGEEYLLSLQTKYWVEELSSGGYDIEWNLIMQSKDSPDMNTNIAATKLLAAQIALLDGAGISHAYAGGSQGVAEETDTSKLIQFTIDYCRDNGWKYPWEDGGDNHKVQDRMTSAAALMNGESLEGASTDALYEKYKGDVVYSGGAGLFSSGRKSLYKALLAACTVATNNESHKEHTAFYQSYGFTALHYALIDGTVDVRKSSVYEEVEKTVLSADGTPATNDDGSVTTEWVTEYMGEKYYLTPHYYHCGLMNCKQYATENDDKTFTYNDEVETGTPTSYENAIGITENYRYVPMTDENRSDFGLLDIDIQNDAALHYFGGDPDYKFLKDGAYQSTAVAYYDDKDGKYEPEGTDGVYVPDNSCYYDILDGYVKNENGDQAFAGYTSQTPGQPHDSSMYFEWLGWSKVRNIVEVSKKDEILTDSDGNPRSGVAYITNGLDPARVDEKIEDVPEKYRYGILLKESNQLGIASDWITGQDYHNDLIKEFDKYAAQRSSQARLALAENGYIDRANENVDWAKFIYELTDEDLEGLGFAQIGGGIGALGDANYQKIKEEFEKYDSFEYSMDQRESAHYVDCSSLVCRVYNSVFNLFNGSVLNTGGIASFAEMHPERLAEITPASAQPGDILLLQYTSQQGGTGGGGYHHAMIFCGRDDKGYAVFEANMDFGEGKEDKDVGYKYIDDSVWESYVNGTNSKDILHVLRVTLLQPSNATP